MNYKQYIQNIINTRGQWNIPKNEYFEGHHIIPRCLGGTGNTGAKEENIIWLYPQEHYEAHKLLALENPNNKALINAWHMMTFPKSKSLQRNIIISAEDYATAKRLLNESKSIKIICIETQEIFNGSREAALKYGNRGNIKLAVNGKRNTAVGYHWAKLDDIVKQKKLKKFVGKSQQFKTKAIICIETQKVFNKIIEASKFYNISRPLISGCLRNKCSTAGGYHWAYKEDIKKQEQLKKFIGKDRMNIKEFYQENYGHKVMCIETKEIFISAKEAARKINIRKNLKIGGGNIMAVCKGRRKTTAGYHWSFVNERSL